MAGGGGYQYPADDGSDYFSQKGGGGNYIPGNPGTGPGPGGGSSAIFGAGGGVVAGTAAPVGGGLNVPDTLRRRYLGPVSGSGMGAFQAGAFGVSPQGQASPLGRASQVGAANPYAALFSGTQPTGQQWQNPDAYNGTWASLYNDPHMRQVSAAKDPEFAAWAAAGGPSGGGMGGYGQDPGLTGINQAAAFGSFNPAGSPGIMDAIRQQFAGQAGNEYRANQAQLRLMPGASDPSMNAFNALQSNLGSQGNLSGALTGAQLGQMQNQQQYAQNLALQRAQFLYGLYQQGTQQRFTQANIGAAQGNPWANALGQIGGAVVGGLTGGAAGGRAQPAGTSYSDMQQPSYGWGGPLYNGQSVQ